MDMILCAQGPCTRPRGPKSLKPIETRRRDPCEGRGGPRGARRFPVGYLHRGVGAGFGVVHTQVQVELRPGDNGPLLSTPLHFLEQSWRFIEKTHQGKNKQPTKKVLRVRTLRIRSLQTFGGEQTVETDFKRSLCALVSRFAFFVSSHYRVILAPKSMTARKVSACRQPMAVQLLSRRVSENAEHPIQRVEVFRFRSSTRAWSLGHWAGYKMSLA